VSLAQLGQLLWAAQGVTHRSGLRAVPSAGALYPLELYAIVAGSHGLEAGIYHYRPRPHGLERVVEGDSRTDFAAAALMQEWLERASVILVVAAAHERTMAKYDERGRRYVAIEAGHAAQDICLQAVALGLGAAKVGAFDDGAVSRLLRLPDEQKPVTSVAVGRPVAAGTL
jgi:SagB-type dehydrogenase family enzyme